MTKRPPKKKTQAKKKSEPRLSEKQRRFVDAYMGEAMGNATQAARLAGYKGSDKTLGVVGVENLAKPRIIKELERLRSQHPITLTREQFREEITAVLLGTDSPHGTKWHSGVHPATKELLPPKSRDRLKAGEIIARTEGWLLTAHSGPEGGPIKTESDAPIDPKIFTADERVRYYELIAELRELYETAEARKATSEAPP